MGMLANGIVFFAGIRFNKDDLAQGVLISSIFWLIAIVFIKFIWQA
jgi:hypothetical protein